MFVSIALWKKPGRKSSKGIEYQFTLEISISPLESDLEWCSDMDIGIKTPNLGGLRKEFSGGYCLLQGPRQTTLMNQGYILNEFKKNNVDFLRQVENCLTIEIVEAFNNAPFESYLEMEIFDINHITTMKGQVLEFSAKQIQKFKDEVYQKELTSTAISPNHSLLFTQPNIINGEKNSPNSGSELKNRMSN